MPVVTTAEYVVMTPYLQPFPGFFWPDPDTIRPVLSGLLDRLGWHVATGRRLGVVMTVQRHDRPHPHIERTFTAVRAALPAANVGAFDIELEAITHAPVVDLAALDEFLSGWLRIATRAAADPADWQRMHQEAEQLQSGARSAGPTLAEVLGRRGVQL
jgi:hypothetical protein